MPYFIMPKTLDMMGMFLQEHEDNEIRIFRNIIL